MSLELENSGNLNVKVPCLLVVYRPPAVAYSDLDFFIEVTCPKYLSLSMVLLLSVSSSMYIFLLLPVDTISLEMEFSFKNDLKRKNIH